jgi:glutamine cyclotransferase
MNRRYTKFLAVFSGILLTTWFLSCSGKPGKNSENHTQPEVKAAEDVQANLIKLKKPGENEELKLNQSFDVEAETVFGNRMPDSVVIVYDSRIVKTLKAEPWKFTVSGDKISTTGRKPLRVIAYKNGKAQTAGTRFLVVFSDIIPKVHRVKVLNTYPHDIHAFTQGLFVSNGMFYESTGQETESSLREVEIKTGKVLRQLNLDRSLFGEGITLYNDRIFQVTWRSKVGFVYEKQSFRQINKIFYQTEGWGLATIGDKIVMSDGTNELSFHDPEMFTKISGIEVYDNEKKVDNLNELEYINGEIWANIWMTDRIARIDPASGKVKSYVDLTGIFPQEQRNPEAEVLNGIAFDKESGKLYVTGKRWSKLFEISVIE